jgi:hypothetical protein
MALTQQHLKSVCVVNGGHLQCRYLDEEVDDQGRMVHVCKKKSPDKKIIDEELIDFYNEMKKTGQDPNKQGVPLGDHCGGYIVLKAKQQGYDVKD